MGAHVARASGATCCDCGDAPQDGRRRCAPHAAAHRKREAKRREALRASGRCVVCARKASAGRSTCKEHGEYYRRRNRVAA